MTNKLTATQSVTIKSTKAEVWDAITNPELIKKYFFGTETVSDFKKGSPIYYRGEWEGKPYEDKGTILEIEKEKIFKHDYWSSFTGTEDKPENYATITYTLSGGDGNVTLTVTQTNVPSVEQKEKSEGNWGMVFDGMKDLLEKNKMIKSIDNFFLPARELEECKKFYSEILGLPVKFDFSDRGLLAFKVGEEEAAIILKDLSKFPDAKPSVLFEVENVEESAKALELMGVIFTKKPYKIATGWAAEFTDPTGNLLGIADYRK